MLEFYGPVDPYKAVAWCDRCMHSKSFNAEWVRTERAVTGMSASEVIERYLTRMDWGVHHGEDAVQHFCVACNRLKETHLEAVGLPEETWGDFKWQWRPLGSGGDWVLERSTRKPEYVDPLELIAEW